MPIGVGLVLALVVGLAACDNSVDPLVEGEVYFAVHGYLDTAADTQFVRVEPIRAAAPASPEAEPLKAKVRLEEAETGRQVALRDSLVRLDDGSTGHLYHAPFAVEAGRTYVLRVQRMDGATTRAAVQLPEPPMLAARVPEILNRSVRQPVVWQGIARPPAEVALYYQVRPSERAAAQEIIIPYNITGAPATGGWMLVVDLYRDAQIIRDRLGVAPADTTSVLVGVAMEASWRSADWMQTPRRSNVEHGEGFLGGIARFTGHWMIPESALDFLGFQDGQP